MATTVEAIYENGVLKPLTSAGLKEKQRYRLTLEETKETDIRHSFSKPHPVLGRIVFNEDPALPIDPEDWPMEETDAPAS